MSNTRNLVWRTEPTGTEGTNTVYVDSYVGDDINGEGTRAKPYKTLNIAWTKIKLYSSGANTAFYIICRGIFSENISRIYSDTMATLCGDYLGAAYFEGKNTYILSGFKIDNLIVRDLRVDGVTGIGYVKYSDNNCATICNNCVFDKTPFYNGYIGATSGGYSVGSKYFNHTVISSPKYHSNYKLQIAGNENGDRTVLTSNTLYNIPRESMWYVLASYGTGMYGRTKCIFNAVLFAKIAIVILNDSGTNPNMEYNNCVFTSDCKFYIGVTSTTEITLTGNTPQERYESLLNQLDTTTKTKYRFNNCIFSPRTSEEIFNNPEAGDFTLIPGCDADAQFNEYKYCGALPPALNLKIKSWDKTDNTDTGSAGIRYAWDETTESGCVKIVNDAICIDTSEDSNRGMLYSKVIKIDPVTTQLNGVYATFHDQWDNYHAYANAYDILKDYSQAVQGSNLSEEIYEVNSTSHPSDTSDPMTVGLYLSTDNAVYHKTGGDVNVGAGGIISVEADTTFTSALSNAKFIKIVEPNIMNCIYVRCRSTAYAQVSALRSGESTSTIPDNKKLQPGGIYFNSGDKEIVYNGRTIVSGESFCCFNSETLYFTCPTQGDDDYKIDIIFDDSRVPAASRWVPAQHFGEYFVKKYAGTIMKDDYNVPLGSGNYESYTDDYNGYKSNMDRKFVQFAIFVKTYPVNID